MLTQGLSTLAGAGPSPTGYPVVCAIAPGCLPLDTSPWLQRNQGQAVRAGLKGSQHFSFCTNTKPSPAVRPPPPPALPSPVPMPPRCHPPPQRQLHSDTIAPGQMGGSHTGAAATLPRAAPALLLPLRASCPAADITFGCPGGEPLSLLTAAPHAETFARGSGKAGDHMLQHGGQRATRCD